jgi:nicotinamidase/pyrazinamidase
MSKEALLLVDVLKGFLEPDYPLFCGEDSRKIIPKIVQLLGKKTAEGTAVLYLCDWHEKEDPEFSMFPVHCVRGTQEAEIVDELSPFPGTIIHKTTISGFYKTDLERHLKELSPQEIYVVGVCTDICVQYVVADLRVRGYDVIVPEECVASFDPEGHRYAMRYMDKVLGAKVIWAA